MNLLLPNSDNTLPVFEWVYFVHNCAKCPQTRSSVERPTTYWSLLCRCSQQCLPSWRTLARGVQVRPMRSHIV
eukprot:7697953-Pyramimonas_sp.AAC.1